MYIRVYMWILQVTQALAAKKVKYAIAGGFAVALHGVVRGTVDIDLVVATDRANLAALEAALKGLGLMSRIPVTAEEMFQFRTEYIRKRNLVAWSFVDPTNPVHAVDAIILHPYQEGDVVKFSINGHKVPVLSRSALIAMKRKAGRPQDLEDVKALEKWNEKS